MRVRRIRQHVGEFFRRDWLEGFVTAFGIIVLALALFATFVTIYALVHLNDTQSFNGATKGWMQGASGVLVAFFGILAAMCWAAAWGLVGKRAIRSVGASIRARRGSSG